MKRLLTIAAWLLCLVTPAFAQFTSVTGTVVDPNGLPYANGTISARLILPGGTSPTLNGFPYTPPSQPTGLDKNGTFLLRIADNTILLPGATTWNFTVCSAGGTILPAGGKGSVCFSLVAPITISGSSQDISAQLNAVALALAFPSGITFPINPNTGQSISPVNLGQNAATQGWIIGGIPSPTLNVFTSGGNLLTGHAIRVQITLNTASGETGPSQEATVSTTSNNSRVEVTQPALASGFTGYTVYSCDNGAVGCELKQTALNSCVNITGTCVIQTAGAGAAPSTTNTAWGNPPNLQVNECAPGVIPTGFMQTVDGNYHTQWGVDPLSNNISPAGTWVICRRTFMTDMKNSPVSFNNSFVAINHGSGTGTSAANQDRALSVFTQNPVGDVATRYAMEGIQVELDLNGTPTINGSPDGEVSAVSVQLADLHTGNMSGPTNAGFNGIRVSTSRSGAGTWSSCGSCITGINVEFHNNNTTSFNSGYVSAIQAVVTDPTAGTPAMGGIGINILAPPTGQFLSLQNIGLQIGNFKQNHTQDYNIYSTGTGGTPTDGRNWLPGQIYTQGFQSAASTMNVGGSFANTGSLSTAQFSTPAQPNVTVNGVTGATTWAYTITYVDGNSKSTPAPASNSIANGNATLGGSNTNSICTINGNPPVGITRVDVYRTTAGGTPNTTGKIGSITPTNNQNGVGAICLIDNGLAGDGAATPTLNLTGSVSPPLYATATNCAAVGTAASPSVASCTAAPAGLFSCATNAVSTCRVNTTAVTTLSEVFVQQRTDTTAGTRLGVTCNTTLSTVRPDATAVVAGTSFDIGLTQPVTNPNCYNYWIVNQ